MNSSARRTEDDVGLETVQTPKARDAPLVKHQDIRKPITTVDNHDLIPDHHLDGDEHLSP